MSKEEFNEYINDAEKSIDDFFKLTDAFRDSEENKINECKTITWFEYESL